MSEFGAWLQTLGLRPRTIAADAKVRRCPTETHPRKRNGAYWLGTDGAFGWAQDWATMTEPVTWTPERQDVPTLDLDALRESQRLHEEAQRKAVHEARAYYDGCTDLRGGHPYLEAHGLTMLGCGGLKVDAQGWLVIPAYSGRAPLSLQRIAPDGTKRFWPGAPIRGTRYVIGRGHGVTVLCEGFATGAACYAALHAAGRDPRVVVLWDAGNMERAAIPTRGWKVVAADNDHETEKRTGKNPGIESGRRAAESARCGYAYPTGIRGTDWCDFRQEERAKRLELPHRSAQDIERAVDAEMARRLMSAAVYVTRVGA